MIPVNSKILPKEYKMNFSSRNIKQEHPMALYSWVKHGVTPILGKDSQKLPSSRFCNSLDHIKNPIYLQTLVSDLKDNHDVFLNNIIKMFKHYIEIIKEGRYTSSLSKPTLPDDFLSQFYNHGLITDKDLPKLFTSGAGIIGKNDFNFFVMKKKKLTPFDTKEIVNARVKTYLNSINIPKQILDGKINKILQKELKKIQRIPSEKQLILIHGAPGSGKSTVINRINKNSYKAYYVKEPDDIKKELYGVLSEDEGGIIAHKMAKSLLLDTIYPTLMKDGRNFIYAATNDLNLEKVLKEALKNKYEVSFIKFVCDKEFSLDRTFNRRKQGGRFTDPYDTYLMENLGDSGLNIFSYPGINKYMYFPDIDRLSQNLQFSIPSGENRW